VSNEFVLEIPCSVLVTKQSTLLVQYAHGFFHHCREVQDRWLRETASRHRWIVFGLDWYGMSAFDLAHWVRIILGDASDFGIVSDTIVQGHLFSVALMRLMRTTFANDPAVCLGNVSLINTERVAFYGISQGSILGGATAALSTDIQRVAFSVPGASITLLLTRATEYRFFGPGFDITFAGQRNIRLLLSMFGMLFEPVESAGWLETLANKTVLLQTAVDDPQVTNLAAFLFARGVRANTIYPQTRPVYLVPEQPSNTTTGNTLVEFHYLDVPPRPINNTSPSPGRLDPHDCPRHEHDGQE
jgi:hypothetical protein